MSQSFTTSTIPLTFEPHDHHKDPQAHHRTKPPPPQPIMMTKITEKKKYNQFGNVC